MDSDLLSYTFEKLNSLKFNELQKLSSHFHVNKRWAKKRELIEKLLQLRDQKIKNSSAGQEVTLKEVNITENEWVDGANAFGCTKSDESPGCEDNNRRLTYTINHGNSSNKRITFNVTKPEEEVSSGVTNFESSDRFDRRLTYNVDHEKIALDKLKTHIFPSTQHSKHKNLCEGSAVTEENNCEIKKRSTREWDTSDVTINSMVSREGAVTSNKVNNNIKAYGIQREARDLEAEIKQKFEQADKEVERLSSKVKMLTIPYTRVLRQNKKFSTKESKENDLSRIKIANKSVAIKKCNISVEKNKYHSSKIMSHKNALQIHEKHNGIKDSEILAKNGALHNRLPKPEITSEIQGKTLIQSSAKVSTRRKSKTEDNILVQKLNISRNIKFFSPRDSVIGKLSHFKDISNPLTSSVNSKSKIPKAKYVDSTKPINATKMPDFSKIHKKRFEQMDSLHDYQRKKQERAKRLFGIPQPGVPSKVSKNKISGVFESKSNVNEKENHFAKLENIFSKGFCNNIKEDKEKPNRKNALNHIGSKLDIMSNIKEQNRKHLSGVRTNKRFELQMKFRKL